MHSLSRACYRGELKSTPNSFSSGYVYKKTSRFFIQPYILTHSTGLASILCRVEGLTIFVTGFTMVAVLVANFKGECMGNSQPASVPVANDGRQPHLRTFEGDLNPFCLLVGHHLRARMIADEFFENPIFIEGSDYRSYVSYSGIYRGIPVSVVTHLIGSPSLCTILPEAYNSGARLFIRVGTCGALIKEAKPGDAIVVDSALRLEGTSKNYAPKRFPANANPDVVKALMAAAEILYQGRYFVGTEATTDDFREGQGRPSPDTGKVSDIARRTHEYVMRQGAICYSMEASALFVWCATHWGGIPSGAINAVVANRITNEWEPKGEKEVAHIALEAIRLLVGQK